MKLYLLYALSTSGFSYAMETPIDTDIIVESSLPINTIEISKKQKIDDSNPFKPFCLKTIQDEATNQERYQYTCPISKIKYAHMKKTPATRSLKNHCKKCTADHTIEEPSVFYESYVKCPFFGRPCAFFKNKIVTLITLTREPENLRNHFDKDHPEFSEQYVDLLFSEENIKKHIVYRKSNKKITIRHTKLDTQGE